MNLPAFDALQTDSKLDAFTHGAHRAARSSVEQRRTTAVLMGVCLGSRNQLFRPLALELQRHGASYRP
jgi:hypothetical protein